MEKVFNTQKLCYHWQLENIEHGENPAPAVVWVFLCWAHFRPPSRGKLFLVRLPSVLFPVSPDLIQSKKKLHFWTNWTILHTLKKVCKNDKDDPIDPSPVYVL